MAKAVTIRSRITAKKAALEKTAAKKDGSTDAFLNEFATEEAAPKKAANIIDHYV